MEAVPSISSILLFLSFVIIFYFPNTRIFPSLFLSMFASLILECSKLGAYKVKGDEMLFILLSSSIYLEN